MTGKQAHAGKHEVTPSSVDKVMYPDDDITKGDVLAYYSDVAEVMVPHLRDRPLTMRRFPDGIGKSGFFQQEAQDYFPDWIQTADVPRRQGEGTVRHVLVQDADMLVYLANQACLEFHTWLARADKLDCPDLMVIDLDPPEGTGLNRLRQDARLVTDVYTELGLTTFLQATGGRGFHLTTPLTGDADSDTVRELARGIARLLAAESPTLLTTEQRKSARGDRVFLDTNRNAYGQTAVAPYSLRARPGAPAATPITIDELSRVEPNRYGLRNESRRLARKKDPWADIHQHAGSAEDALARLAELGRSGNHSDARPAKPTGSGKD
jgi:bifunctional non-homologous end joining protein LigD